MRAQKPYTAASKAQVRHNLQGTFLFRASIGAALLLGLLHLILIPIWGSGPVLVALPWFIPMFSSFLAVTALCVAYLAFGRYQWKVTGVYSR